MAAIKRVLLPPTLKTVKLPTLSALGKDSRSSAKELKSVRLAIRYQDSRAVEQSGCLLANSSNRFRVMMCMEINISICDMCQSEIALRCRAFKLSR